MKKLVPARFSTMEAAFKGTYHGLPKYRVHKMCAFFSVLEDVAFHIATIGHDGQLLASKNNITDPIFSFLYFYILRP
jgi:hypothetical protein